MTADMSIPFMSLAPRANGADQNLTRRTPGHLPRISLCVPTYNRAHLLRHCVSTLLNQTAKDIEVVVVDNCSSDDTLRVGGEFSGHPRFRFFRNAENVGPQQNWNRCVDAARGDYLAICHDDDFYAPTFAEECGSFLDAHPSVGFVHCGYRVTNMAGIPISGYRAYPTERVIPSAESFVQYLWDSHNVAFSAVMARRSAYEVVGRFRDGFICGDYDMWLRMAFRFDVGYLSRSLVYYRTHDESMSRDVPLRRWYEEHLTIIDDALAMASEAMPELTRQREQILGKARKLWARRGLREAVSRASYGNMVGARQYLEVADSLACTLSLRFQVRVAQLLLSPAGAALLGRLRPAWHRARHLRFGERTLQEKGL